MPNPVPHLPISCKTSMHIGKKWSAAHNRRSYDKEKWNRDGHITADRSALNVTLRDSDLRTWFHQTFDQAIAAFNAKNEGKHNDRLINPDAYYQEQKGRVQECIIQLGDHAAYMEMVDQVGQEIADDIHIRFLTDAFRQWEKDNPSLRVFSAIIHMDEIRDGTPHLHLDFVPVAESKRGLSVKVSMDGAMKELGFDRKKGQKYAETPYKQWLAMQRELVEALASQYVNLIPSDHNTGKQHIETWEYKAEQARQKAAQLDSERKERQDEVQRLAEEENRLSEELAPLRDLKVSTEEVQHIGKAALGFVTVKKKDFELLQAQAAAYRAHQADLADIQEARRIVAQQRTEVQQLRRSEESRIVAAEKRAYSDTRTVIRCHESNAAEDARKAEAALIEAERIRDENKKQHQENIQYRERLREREKAALDEYSRNNGAIERLKRSEALSARLMAQITSLQKAQTDAAAAHQQEIVKMQEKLRQTEKQQAERDAVHQQELAQMQEKFDLAEKENNSLRSRLSAAVSSIVEICQTIGMLDDYRGGEYSKNSLSDRQSSLVSTLREIGSEIVAKLGFRQASQNIDNTVDYSAAWNAPIRNKENGNPNQGTHQSETRNASIRTRNALAVEIISCP